MKFLESVPCSSLNKTLKNFGTCFDVQNGWQTFSWQSFWIFDKLVTWVSTCKGMWTSRCNLPTWKSTLASNMACAESCISNLMSKKGTFVCRFLFPLKPAFPQASPFVLWLTVWGVAGDGSYDLITRARLGQVEQPNEEVSRSLPSKCLYVTQSSRS